EAQPWLLVEPMPVDRRPLAPVRPQRLDHGTDFVSGQHEVAGDGGLAAAGGLEVDRGRHAHGSGGSKLHSILADWVAARHTELIDAAVRLPFGAEDRIELAGVEIDRGLRSWRCRGLQGGLACCEPR